MLDAFTIAHLDKWLGAQLHSDDPYQVVRAAMIAKANEDSEYWLSKGWWDVYYAADCGAIIRRNEDAAFYPSR